MILESLYNLNCSNKYLKRNDNIFNFFITTNNIYTFKF